MPSRSETSVSKPDGCILTADWYIYDVLLDAGEWVFATRASAERFLQAGGGIVYLTQRGGAFSGLAAEVQAVGNVIEHKVRASYYLLYPFAVKISILHRPQHPIPIKPLLPRLSFVPAGSAWGLAFKGDGCRKIPSPDLAVLRKAIVTAESASRG